MAKRLALVLAALLGWAGIARADVMVYVPGSLSQAFTEIAAVSAKAGHPFTVVSGHSPAQAQQIVEGAPADTYVSTDPKWMEFLKSKNMLDDGSEAVLASTRLVLVTTADCQP